MLEDNCFFYYIRDKYCPSKLISRTCVYVFRNSVYCVSRDDDFSKTRFTRFEKRVLRFSTSRNECKNRPPRPKFSEILRSTGVIIAVFGHVVQLANNTGQVTRNVHRVPRVFVQTAMICKLAMSSKTEIVTT